MCSSDLKARRRSAPLFSRPPVAVGLLIAFGLWTRTISGYPDIPAHREGREKMAELTAAVRPYVKDRCLYVFDGPPALYLTSGTCLATPYIFPDHLNGDMERDAIGVDTSREMTRLLDSRPGAIVTASAPVIPKLNEATLQLLRARLRRDYVRVAAINNPKRTLYVYALKTQIGRAHV